MAMAAAKSSATAGGAHVVSSGDNAGAPHSPPSAQSQAQAQAQTPSQRRMYKRGRRQRRSLPPHYRMELSPFAPSDDDLYGNGGGGGDSGMGRSRAGAGASHYLQGEPPLADVVACAPPHPLPLSDLAAIMQHATTSLDHHAPPPHHMASSSSSSLSSSAASSSSSTSLIAPSSSSSSSSSSSKSMLLPSTNASSASGAQHLQRLQYQEHYYEQYQQRQQRRLGQHRQVTLVACGPAPYPLTYYTVGDTVQARGIGDIAREVSE
jgi:hypothetical protein